RHRAGLPKWSRAVPQGGRQMSAVVWALFAVALGCALVYRFGILTGLGPAWAVALLLFGAGAAAGMGLTSCLFFVCRLVVPGMPKLALFVEIAIGAWLGFEIWRQPRQAFASTAGPDFPYSLLLLGTLIVALGIATGAMPDTWEANPQGNWDAWSIWNLRARFVAGDLPQRAWS